MFAFLKLIACTQTESGRTVEYGSSHDWRSNFNCGQPSESSHINENAESVHKTGTTVSGTEAS